MTPDDELWEGLSRRFEVSVSTRQRDRVRTYWSLLEKWNDRINLTRIASFEDALRRHFFEGFWAAEHVLSDVFSLADLGSGAGFPGIAIKIYRPDLKLRVVEKNRRKAAFLGQVARELSLDITVSHRSVEEDAGWRSLDAITMRALLPGAELACLLEMWPGRILLFHGRRPLLPDTSRQHQRFLLPESEHRFVSVLHEFPQGCFT